MVSECTLGRGQFGIIRGPGPIVSYTWHDYILPAWLLDHLRDGTLSPMAGLEQAVCDDILANAVPNRADRDDDPMVVEALRIMSERLGGGVDIAGRTHRR